MEHGLVLSMHSLAHCCLARWVPHLLRFEGELPGIRVFLLTFVCIIPLLLIFTVFFSFAPEASEIRQSQI